MGTIIRRLATSRLNMTFNKDKDLTKIIDIANTYGKNDNEFKFEMKIAKLEHKVLNQHDFDLSQYELMEKLYHELKNANKETVLKAAIKLYSMKDHAGRHVLAGLINQILRFNDPFTKEDYDYIHALVKKCPKKKREKVEEFLCEYLCGYGRYHGEELRALFGSDAPQIKEFKDLL